jgi:hypothetical protein
MTAPTRTNRIARFATRRDPPAVVWVKRICIAAFAIHVVFFTWSIYRRIWQVVHIEVGASSIVLTPGVTVSYDVITTGEVHNHIRLELVQGTHAETILEERSRVSSISAYDPRLFRYERTVAITPALLSRFTPGPGTLRLTGFGSQKLLRTPVPRVRELAVQIGAPATSSSAPEPTPLARARPPES